ncbi:ATP synthase F1 subunit delta [Anoxybacter fermentans]|uniref:ATP synthase subunit delta n=1 Tax=Anoxybacter fermentans TaxID=1323375 RepID=A0A3Q9HRZ6_9FIRM|nr:ATP synthase F1 subunit delta [Anoxybacter fermentans]AZR73999.1 ATP synthase F1 subunit delta [Anoxybacter fermentans]
MLKNAAVERYTKALFDLAVEENSLDQFNQELIEINRLLTDQPDLERLLNHPQIPDFEKRDLIKRILGSEFSPLILNFILLLIDKGRQTLLKDIIEYFQYLVKEARGIVEVQVYTAFELSSENESKLKQKLKELTGKEVELQVTVDPSLIGGIRLRIGDKVIDGSIKRHLERMREDLAQIQVSQLGVS